MAQRRFKTYLLIAAFISAVLVYNLKSGGNRQIEGPFFSHDDVMTNRYNFLYGKDFERALDRAGTSPRKKILFWHPEGETGLSFTASVGRECGECDFVNDRALIEDESTAAVVFFHKYVRSQIMPTKRNPKQYWIFRTGETPPSMIRENTLPYADQVGFNLTMSYRRDSDIRIYYGYLDEMTLPKPEQILQKKKHLALIVTSNCDYLPGAKVRMELIQNLIQEGLSLTTSGACFPNNKQFPRSSRDELRTFTSEHKFYLAFENTYHCKDYVTEKFFRAIEAGTVPVVWGSKKEDYTKFVPESAFIFVEDFPTLQDLIQHLNFLDKNDGDYMKYFEWRKTVPSNAMEKSFICQTCRLLHGIRVDDAYTAPYSKISKSGRSYISDKLGTRKVKSLSSWWMNGDNPECLRTPLRLNKYGKVIFK